MNKPRVPVHFEFALRGARAVRGFSLRQVSEGTGISVWRLGHFEKGSLRPAPSEFAKIWWFLSSEPIPDPEQQTYCCAELVQEPE